MGDGRLRAGKSRRSTNFSFFCRSEIWFFILDNAGYARHSTADSKIESTD